VTCSFKVTTFTYHQSSACFLGQPEHSNRIAVAIFLLFGDFDESEESADIFNQLNLF
jgi:hypothetical protein